VATLAASEGWCEQFTREALRTWFMDKLDPGHPEVLDGILALRRRPADCIVRAADPAVVQQYVENTDAARALGIFGSPTFVHGGKEFFWGDDRLEEAIAWA